jgi:hypothetical protein
LPEHGSAAKHLYLQGLRVFRREKGINDNMPNWGVDARTNLVATRFHVQSEKAALNLVFLNVISLANKGGGPKLGITGDILSFKVGHLLHVRT